MPHLRVYNMNAGMCDISCAPRATGRTRDLEQLRASILACSCETEEECELVPDLSVERWADYLTAALPLTIFAVLADKLEVIVEDLGAAIGVAEDLGGSL